MILISSFAYKSSCSLSFSKFKQLTVSPSKSPFKSPVKKRMRISSACSSPFADRTNLDSPARADFQLFCKRQMTRNLPRRNNSSEVDDSIKEKPASDKKLPRKNIMEFFRQKTIDKPVAPLNDPTKGMFYTMYHLFNSMFSFSEPKSHGRLLGSLLHSSCQSFVKHDQEILPASSTHSSL